MTAAKKAQESVSSVYEKLIDSYFDHFFIFLRILSSENRGNGVFENTIDSYFDKLVSGNLGKAY